MAADRVLTTPPLISVVMPVYNAAAYLQEAIDSVLNQSESNFELLLIDDASTDASPALMDRYTDPRIRRITHTENKGLIASLNEGYALARGQYIARMDADDICLPERFRLQRQLMDDYPYIGVCGCWVEVFGDQQEEWRYPEREEFIRAGFLYSCCMAHPAVMLRTAMVREKVAAYEPAYIHGEDYKLWVTLTLNGVLFYNLPQVLLRYRSHSTQVSSSKQAQQRESCNRAREFYLQTLFPYLSQEEMALHNRLANLDYEANNDFIQRAIRLMNTMRKHHPRLIPADVLNDLLQRKLFDIVETALKKNAGAWRLLQGSDLRPAFWSKKGLKLFTKYILKLCYLL